MHSPTKIKITSIRRPRTSQTPIITDQFDTELENKKINSCRKQWVFSNRKCYSEKLSPQKRQLKNQQDLQKIILKNTELPSSYYFDKKIKKQITRKIVDNYLGPLGNTTDLITTNYMKDDNPQRKTSMINPRILSMNQRISKTAQGGARRLARSQLIQNIPKISINRQINPYMNNKSLPIIQQFPKQMNQYKTPRRPQLHQQIDFDVSPLIKKRRSMINPFQLKQEFIIDNQSSYSVSFSKISQASNETAFTLNQNKMSKYFQFVKMEGSTIGGQIKIIKQFTEEGSYMLEKDLKMRKFGAKVLWEVYPYSNNMLVFTNCKSLCKEMYYKVSRMHANQSVHKIVPSQSYNLLFANKNEELIDIILCLCKQLLQIEGKIIINGIRLRNIYRLGQKQVYIGDWTNSALKQQVPTNGGISLVNYHDPILKDQAKLLCQPEYLAPQIIQYLKDTNNTEQMFKNRPSSSDVWSLGCLILQLLTLIPLGTGNRYSIKGRSTFRRGLLNINKFSVDQFLRKQKLFLQQYKRIIKMQIQNLEIDQKIFKVLDGTLKYNKEDRMTLLEIINILK